MFLSLRAKYCTTAIQWLGHDTYLISYSLYQSKKKHRLVTYCFSIGWTCSPRTAQCWHLSLALRASVNLNHARKIQPHAILELPGTFTIRSKHCACRLLLACATYVLAHFLIIGSFKWSHNAFHCSEHLLCYLVPTNKTACLHVIKWLVMQCNLCSVCIHCKVQSFLQTVLNESANLIHLLINVLT